MDPEKIKELFLMFTEEQESPLHEIYLKAAQEEVQRQILPAYAERTPVLLNAYAAVVAVRLWAHADAVRNHAVCTSTGGISAVYDNTAQRSAACAMVSAYRAMCRPFLKDETFLLLSAPVGQAAPQKVPPEPSANTAEEGAAVHD